MPRRYGQDDLLEMPAAGLQRSLLGVTDELLARAVLGAGPAVRAALLGNVSRRRRAGVELLVAGLKQSGALDRRAARDSLLRLIAQVFRIGGPEEVGESPRSESKPRTPTGDQRSDSPAPPGPDLTPGAFARLKEAHGIAEAFEKFSAHARHLANCRRGLSGAVLVHSWLGRRPVVSGDRILRVMCSEPQPKPGPKARRGKRG